MNCWKFTTDAIMLTIGPKTRNPASTLRQKVSRGFSEYETTKVP
jgi:hypothetical protein